MSKTRITLAVAVVAAAGAGLWFYQRADAQETASFRFASVTRGDVRSTVAATGTLSAVRTVQVGTQVSGQVSAIYVDFNDRVTKGQLIARIDPTLQQQSVQDAEAGLARAQSQYDQAKAEYDRQKQLFDAKIVTASEFGTAQSSYEVAKANLTSARISLEKAHQNLAYTNIYAPIDGVVVSRDVDVGQTVAASLSAPQLFLVATDLSRMQILATVDESDIGLIKEGQPVAFTVQAYPNESFTGTVEQVRLQSTLQDNVVNYTAVVSVRNPEGKLLPGMTATVEFQTGSAEDVLMVPNAALRFRPTPEMLAEPGAMATEPARRGAAGGGDQPEAREVEGARGANGTARRGGAAPGAPPNGTMRDAAGAAGTGSPRDGANGGMSGAPRNVATLWTVNAAGKLVPHRVRTGLSNGQQTQVQGPDLEAGMEVVIGTAIAEAENGGTGGNPLAPQRGRGRRGF
ncbi:MAG TPA: efflux RND transporter periplasmic adaptor subunit [Gemmatimonadaceae bacterium]|nr:efflux RND transporter periplasmic adaptor subunit [Gemmatimonadaceae bacterium]